MSEHAEHEHDVYDLRPLESAAKDDESVRIEAAEFLVATRAQQEHRLRVARELEELRRLAVAAPAVP